MDAGHSRAALALYHRHPPSRAALHLSLPARYSFAPAHSEAVATSHRLMLALLMGPDSPVAVPAIVTRLDTVRESGNASLLACRLRGEGARLKGVDHLERCSHTDMLGRRHYSTRWIRDAAAAAADSLAAAALHSLPPALDSAARID